MTRWQSFEELQEALIRLEKARRLERQRAAENDAILTGLSELVAATSRDEVVSILHGTFRKLIDCRECWVMQLRDGRLVSDMTHRVFPLGPRFARVLDGQPLNAFDVSKIPEWNEADAGNIGSALHLPLNLGDRKGMVILVSDRRAAFVPASVELARRIVPFAEQAMSRLELIELEHAREMAEQQRLMSLILEHAPVAIWMLDTDRSIRFFNPRFCELIGLNEFDLPGTKDYTRLLPEPVARRCRESDDICLEEGRLVRSRQHMETCAEERLLDTLKVPIKDERGRITGLIGIAVDVTEQERAVAEREQMERRLLHAQKLESLGVLAGGIAHDFNNILSAIMGHADMARRRAARDPSAVEVHYTRIVEAADRAADLCKQMLAYSGKGKFVVRPLDLSQTVREIADMLEVSLNKGVVLKLSLQENLPRIEADPSQLQQVIMNLITNANDAIGEQSGIIAIRTGVMRVDESYLQHCVVGGDAEPGGYVFLEVADTGRGMDAATVARIFDPFFTTKASGRGLGMSAVSGIVRGHHGAMRVYSEPGNGTTMRVLFPALGVVEAADRMEQSPDTESETNGQEHTPTILVVDDEEVLREMAVMVLNEAGYANVEVAENGVQALKLFEQRGGDIGCVLLDLTMPHMDGEETFRRLKTMDPDVRVIICSGYSESHIKDRFAGKNVCGFLQKPYMPDALLQAVRRAMDEETIE